MRSAHQKQLALQVAEAESAAAEAASCYDFLTKKNGGLEASLTQYKAQLASAREGHTAAQREVQKTEQRAARCEAEMAAAKAALEASKLRTAQEVAEAQEKVRAKHLYLFDCDSAARFVFDERSKRSSTCI